jgi:hypothetical protein
LARTNYSFEKRQRELAKKRKKEEKAAKKAAGGGEEELNPNEAAMALPPAGQVGPDEADDDQAPGQGPEGGAAERGEDGADEGAKPATGAA